MTGLFTRRMIWGFMVLFVACVPAFSTLLTIQHTLNRSLGDFFPRYWSDEIGYWHYVASFHAVGFDNGYYVPDEQPAPVAWARYDAHGPSFALIYGMMAKVTGWDYQTGIWFNFLWVGLGVFLVAVLGKLDVRQLLTLGLFVGTCWVVIYFLPYINQEPLHYFIGACYALFFYHLLAHQSQTTRGVIIAFMVFTVVVCLVRFSWGLMVAPFLLMISPRKNIWTVLRSLFLTAIFLVMMLRVAGLFAPSGNNYFISFLSGDMPFDILLGQIERNLRLFFLTDLNGSYWNVYNVQMVQHVAILGGMLWQIWRNRRVWHTQQESLFYVYTLGATLVLILLLYVYLANFRLLGVFWWMCCLLLILKRHFRWMAVIIISNILVMGSFWGTFTAFHSDDFNNDFALIAQQQAEIATVLAYIPDVPSAWCNTILIEGSLYDFRVLLMPRGMGISYYTYTPPTLIRSRYLYVMNTDVINTVTNRLARVTEFSFGGVLYENLDADCPTS